MSLLQNSNAIETGGYTISKSLRVRGQDASAYLNRTPASAGNRRTWTYSAWIKRGRLTPAAGGQSLFYAGNSTTTPRGGIVLGNAGDDKLSINGMLYNSTSNVLSLETTAQYRDPSAWYHIIVALDTTQATAADRCKIYVNGSQVTAFGTATYPSQNAELQYNDAILHATRHPSANYYYDGYLAEVNFIDGQALTPSSFGQTDVLTGVWTAKKYTGTYGTNGFYLPLTNTSTTSTLVADSSGNGNNWTPNNISLTAGTTYDSMLDSPTMSMTSTTTPVGNYCVLNRAAPLPGTAGYSIPLYDGNLRATSSSGNTLGAGGTIVFPSGKWYWEFVIGTISGASSGVSVGINSSTFTYPNVDFSVGYGYSMNGTIRKLNVDSAYGASFTTGDIIGIAYDSSANTLTFYKNNVSQGQITGISTSYAYIPWIYYGGSSNSNTVNANFGQRPFSYTPPSGYKALCTTNLPDSTIVKGNQYMDATLYTGNGSTASITNAASFKPDFVWAKDRTSANAHSLYDSVRGATKQLCTVTTDAEDTQTGGVTAFNSNGFSLGSYARVNANTDAYVGWQWQAGQGTTSSNTSGSITSTTSVNATAGFSIVTYTGTGANATVGHGLGVAPKMIIVKVRSTTNDWPVYHANLTSAAYRLQLNTTIAQANTPTAWNSTAPTSSVFSIGTLTETNASSQTFVAYCFAEIAGFSKFGSYTGNGSADGPFVYCGFQPKFILIKRSDAVASWILHDTSRSPYNQQNNNLYPNLSNAEDTGSTIGTDALSNGFKIRATDAGMNANGGTFIYMAFASNPFKNSNAF